MGEVKFGRRPEGVCVRKVSGTGFWGGKLWVLISVQWKGVGDLRSWLKMEQPLWLTMMSRRRCVEVFWRMKIEASEMWISSVWTCRACL